MSDNDESVDPDPPTRRRGRLPGHPNYCCPTQQNCQKYQCTEAAYSDGKDYGRNQFSGGGHGKQLGGGCDKEVGEGLAVGCPDNELFVKVYSIEV